MDNLFELLFIALFILFPILEGVLKQRKKGKPDPSGSDEEERDWAEPDRVEPGEAQAEPAEGRAAAEMLPDDLWELMTGERRHESGPEEPEQPEEPWSVETEAPSTDPAVEADPWSEPAVDDDTTAPEPASLEYEGPEAYTLETPAPEPLERTVPTAKARHRAFHELVDRPRREPARRTSPLMRSLRSPDGLRQAVLLREILGPPKGLE